MTVRVHELDSHQAILDAWFAAEMSLAAEFGGFDDYLATHRTVVLTALANGLEPPDWPDYLDFVRDGDD